MTRAELQSLVILWALARHTHFGNKGCAACRRFKELQALANRLRRQEAK
jgi:hypothetical protein